MPHAVCGMRSEENNAITFLFRIPHSKFRIEYGERSSIGQSTGLWLQGLRVRVPPFTPQGPNNQ